MADRLHPDRALSLAKALTTIADFPRYPEAIEATAEDLMDWCIGSFLDGCTWSAEEQAEWLVKEARRRFDPWPGTLQLQRLFNNKFRREVGFPQMRHKPECSHCDSTGWMIFESDGASGAKKCTYCTSGSTVDSAPTGGRSRSTPSTRARKQSR